MPHAVDSELSQAILAFLRNHTLMAVATVGENGVPDVAAVSYAEQQDLGLVFETVTDSNKYRNLQLNQAVACVVWDTAVTVQYQGIARELSGDELANLSAEYVAKNPLSRRLVDPEGARFFKVVPHRIRYTNVSVNPWQVLELKLPQNK